MLKHNQQFDPLLTGTPNGRPLIFPFNSGITSPIALAAPIVVGIIDTNAERDLRGSLRKESSNL